MGPVERTCGGGGGRREAGGRRRQGSVVKHGAPTRTSSRQPRLFHRGHSGPVWLHAGAPCCCRSRAPRRLLLEGRIACRAAPPGTCLTPCVEGAGSRPHQCRCPQGRARPSPRSPSPAAGGARGTCAGMRMAHVRLCVRRVSWWEGAEGARMRAAAWGGGGEGQQQAASQAAGSVGARGAAPPLRCA